jgi:hypothetical protein
LGGIGRGQFRQAAGRAAGQVLGCQCRQDRQVRIGRDFYLVEQTFASTNHYEWLQSATQAQAADKSLAACVLMIRLEMKEDLRQKNGMFSGELSGLSDFIELQV